MTKHVLFTSDAGDVPADLAFKNNYAATVDPTVNDDITFNYTAGSTWINQTTGTVWTCTANTDGAAVWALSSQGGTGTLVIVPQAAPTAKTVSSTLTAAQLLAGIITVAQGAGAVSAQQMPTGTAIQAALPASFGVNDAFDFSVINLGGASEVASITVNTDVTIVGNAAIPIPATGAQSSARFRVRKTADHVFVVYRIA